MPVWLERWFDSLQEFSWWEILLYSFLAAFVLQWLLTRVTLLFTRRTETTLDDDAVKALRWPLFLTVLFVGAGLAIRGGAPGVAGTQGTDVWRAQQDALESYQHWARIAIRVMWTLGIFFWTRALMKIGDGELLVQRG